LSKKNDYVLEQVFSPLVLQTSPEHDELREIARGCVTCYHCYHYLGFAETQWKLMQKRLVAACQAAALSVSRAPDRHPLHASREIEANLVTLNQIWRPPISTT
jgi:uncharacterized protein